MAPPLPMTAYGISAGMGASRSGRASSAASEAATTDSGPGRPPLASGRRSVMARIDPADRRYSLSVAICLGKGQSPAERRREDCRIVIALPPSFGSNRCIRLGQRPHLGHLVCPGRDPERILVNPKMGATRDESSSVDSRPATVANGLSYLCEYEYNRRATEVLDREADISESSFHHCGNVPSGTWLGDLRRSGRVRPRRGGWPVDGPCRDPELLRPDRTWLGRAERKAIHRGSEGGGCRNEDLAQFDHPGGKACRTYPPNLTVHALLGGGRSL